MNDFDIGSLEIHLLAHLPGFQAPLTIERFAGGQSDPIYRLHGSDGTQYVLRKKPSGILLPSAHAVEREYRVIAALQSTNVPVAPSFHLCEDSAVIGTPFYVIADLHSGDPASVGLTDYGKPGDFLARQTVRWRQSASDWRAGLAPCAGTSRRALKPI
jgi:aminoglycoside phosphotransferase (APT) family kinase protein